MKNKKILIIIALFMVISLIMVNAGNVSLFANAGLAGDITTNTCTDPGVIKTFRILAYVVTILKVLVPIIIIITGIKTGIKSVIEEDDGGAKKLAGLLIQKICIGAFIFFIPSIVGAFMSYIGNSYKSTQNSFAKCGECLNSVSKCDDLLQRYDK